MSTLTNLLNNPALLRRRSRSPSYQPSSFDEAILIIGDLRAQIIAQERTPEDFAGPELNRSEAIIYNVLRRAEGFTSTMTLINAIYHGKSRPANPRRTFDGFIFSLRGKLAPTEHIVSKYRRGYKLLRFDLTPSADTYAPSAAAQEVSECQAQA